jgi:hypothetical protein
LRTGATPNALARVEELFAVHLPDEFRQLYLTSDGFDLPIAGMRILPLTEIEPYADAFAGRLLYVPFTDSNDSNPYAVCCQEPLVRFVAHVPHDDESRLVCRNLPRFFESLDEAIRSGDGADRLAGDLDFAQPDRTTADSHTGRELIRYAEGLDPNYYARGEALRFAAQLFGPGHEPDLSAVLALSDEYVRTAVLRRCRGLNTPPALAIIAADADAFNRFVAGLAHSVAEAGISQDVSRLNLAMLYAGRNRQGFLDDLLVRIRSWQSGQG